MLGISNVGNYGGEGGILATVISRLREFKGVEPLPQVRVFSAFSEDCIFLRSWRGFRKAPI
jgi:hypothetical protein